MLASLVDVRGRVIPLGAVFAPLFSTTSLLWLLCIPQGILYCGQKRGAVDWIQASVYFWGLTLSILFLALLAARVDNGTLEHASWNNIFAPVYTWLVYAAVMLGVSAFCRPARVRGTGSRWGVMVE